MSSRIKDFVLLALQHADALIEDIGYGQYSVLLPEILAHQLQVPTFFTMLFDAEGEDTSDKLYINYGHPLVETLIEHYRKDKTPGHLYVNGLRVEKQGLADLARRSISLPKGRINENLDNVAHPEIFYYVRFFFRATALSDEKHEHLVPITLCAQTGELLANEDWEYQARLQSKPDWSISTTPVAPMFWMPGSPLDNACVSALLQRAAAAVPVRLHDALTKLQQRSERYLELDYARLEGYYDELQADLKLRLRRISQDAEDDTKRQSLLDKIHHLEQEKAAKIADAQQKYALRLHLELINLSIIEQPKVVLQMIIEKGKKHIPATVIWDPLMHRLEPPLYDTVALESL